MSTEPFPLKTPITTARLCKICYNGPKSSLRDGESRSKSIDITLRKQNQDVLFRRHNSEEYLEIVTYCESLVADPPTEPTSSLSATSASTDAETARFTVAAPIAPGAAGDS
ncbi:hypothetical protein VM1G_12044 [Cytospora mali]|nr:hypothetical protein VM1G_12044 [Valsa mali]